MIPLPGFWKRRFLVVEVVLALIGAAAFAIWYFAFCGAATVATSLDGNRATLYGTAASIFGSLLGFAITATSIVLGFSASDRLAVVRGSAHYPQLWKTFSASIRALAVATVVSIVCLIFDRDRSPNTWLTTIMVFSVLLASLRVARTIWVLEQIIALVTAPLPLGRPEAPITEDCAPE